MSNRLVGFRKNSPAASNIEGTLHIDTYLTNYSVMFVQESSMFVAQQACSIIPVVKQTDKYVVYDRGYFWRDEAVPRPLGGRPAQVGYKLGEGTYSATEFALEHTIDDRQRANADAPIRLDENATRLLTQKNLIKQDRVWCQKFFTSGVWSTQVEGVASTPGANQFLQFNDAASEPIETIDQYKDVIARKTGFMPNVLVLGAGVKRVLRTHPDIADRIKYTQIGIAEEQLLATLFGVKRVVVARSVYNAAAEGATDDFQYIADEKSMLLAYIEDNPALDSPTACALWAWTGLMPGANNLGGVIERGRDDRAHSDFFQGRMAWDISQVSADLAVFFNDAIA